MRKVHLIGILFVLSAFQLLAQKKSTFEGIVKYALTLEDSQLPPEATAMFSNAEVVVYITPEMQRTDVNMIIQSTTSIVDMQKKTISTIMEMGGQKYLIKMNEEDIRKEEKESSELKIKYLEETKEVAGYKCSKAEITTAESPEKVMMVYFTEDIPVSNLKPVYKGLKGFPLEYTINMGGIQMKFAAKTISKENIPASTFETARNGYIETTVEELQMELLKQMGGQ